MTNDKIHEEDAVGDVPGARLLVALMARARQDGFTYKQLADHLGISRSYFHSLRYGQRSIAALSRKILEQCARYLGAPLIDVLLLADSVLPSDFVRPGSRGFEADLRQAMEFVSQDRRWGGLLPRWQQLETEVMLVIVLMYEAVTRRHLLPKSPGSISALRSLLSETEEASA